MAELMNMLTPMLALIVWTFVMWFWMYATRIPAMRAAKIDPAKITTRESFTSRLPQKVNNIADNYNHLHEQPTLFYALCVYTHLAGKADTLNIALAWAYVGIRVVHSLIQSTSNAIPLRFFVFATGSLCLMVIGLRNAAAIIVSMS